ncbi:MAG: sigma-54-dependent Fis family transcriptional regulator [Candidatus Zixiibacteriota bacterium]|nr:MAG: sigma-54-dependent Fis family transcriptional regulator [candidate division Zixibacteria bacterium]
MEKLGKILVVDDDPLVLEALHQAFMDEYEVVSASSGFQAIDIVSSDPAVETIVLDIKMAKMDGLKTASKLKQLNPEIPIIFHTGYPGDYSEDEIEKGHAPFDYVGKNERPARLTRAVKNAVSFYRLKRSHSDLATLAREQYGLVGKSRAMLDVYQTIEKIGPTANKVMILGQTGTGKELVARAIHKRSLRANKTLAIFNCNHKAPDLVESELFGHLKGSFTGAVADRIGMFEYADHGTVFLDEIGDLDITTQAKILRVLETGEMQRIGSPETIKVDVRLICATHHDLTERIAEKRFREDLYYRLKGVTITLPPLRDRREDIPELIDFFSRRYCAKIGCGLKIFEPEARDYMIEFEWPGNVRQLLDTVQSLIDLSPSYYITRQEVASYLVLTENPADGDGSFAQRLREFKRTLILKSLDRNANNVSAAARELSLDPSNLRKIIKDLKITLG